MAVVASSGRYPRTNDWRNSPNHWPSNRGRRAVCIHINQGSFENSIAYMLANGTSAHFEVGKKGKIAQLVDVQDSAWCNGLTFNQKAQRWVCPHEHVVSPTWQLLRPGDDNPNWTTISIENEGFSGQPWSASQFDANVDLLIWLGKLFPSLTPYEVGSTLIGHYHLDPRDKLGCPGSGADLARLAEAANKGLGLDQLWRRRWSALGVPLPDDQVGWAIPQAYKPQADALGACVRGETYLVPGFSIALFERGFIYYVAAQERAFVELVELGS